MIQQFYRIKTYAYAAGCWFIAASLLYGFIIYQPSQVHFMHEISGQPIYFSTPVWIVSILLYTFGSSALFLVPFFGLWGYYSANNHISRVMMMLSGIVLLLFTCSLIGVYFHLDFMQDVTPGGLVGISLYRSLNLFFDDAIIFVLMTIMHIIGTLLIVGFAFVSPIAAKVRTLLVPRIKCIKKLLKSLCTTKKQEKVITEEQPVSDPANMYRVPIEEVFKSSGIRPSEQEAWKNRARALEEKLEHFGIEGSVVDVYVGPVVTLFHYEPAITTKISKILSLEYDLALALQALSLRIIAPVPGTSVIGFEVANMTRKSVLCSEIMNDIAYTQTTAQLPIILGKNTLGAPVVIDLALMPHLLVAGSTGSGKSVALHTMLASLVCHCSPDDLRLIIIDPKRLEFAHYADIAHLFFPIVTEAAGAVASLRWAVKTMEDRYALIAKQGVRSLSEYNAINSEKLPFLVIVIDELADLMMVAGPHIELYITRLAQMARAAGIHLIVATQRPSVDVVTGLIKVNFPARIAFKVMSKIDSRTILDAAGAEKLLGKGDMLFLDQHGVIYRAHGAYITDQEIIMLANHIKQQRPVAYQSLEIDPEFTLSIS